MSSQSQIIFGTFFVRGTLYTSKNVCSLVGEGRIQSITKQTDKLGGDEFSNLNEVAFELL